MKVGVGAERGGGGQGGGANAREKSLRRRGRGAGELNLASVLCSARGIIRGLCLQSTCAAVPLFERIHRLALETTQ